MYRVNGGKRLGKVGRDVRLCPGCGRPLPERGGSGEALFFAVAALELAVLWFLLHQGRK